MEKLIVIRTLKELDDLVVYLSDKDYVAFDTETDGVEKSSRVIGFSVAAEPEVGYYVVLSEWIVEEIKEPIECAYCEGGGIRGPTYIGGEHEECSYCDGTGKDFKTKLGGKLVDLETKAEAKDFCDYLTVKKLIMHNAVFDCDMVKNNFGIDLMPSVHTDTMILGHLLDENRSNGLKELGTAIFGEDARKEQKEMQDSVHKNGGMLTKACYELYKADSELIAKYGAKDAVLTLKLFYHFVPELYEQNLDQFFYEDESMPQLRGPTYDLNTTGLRVDPERLQNLRAQLEADCMEARAFIYKEIEPHVKDKYPATRKANTFNIDAPKQLAWLLFFQLGNEFNTLTKTGKEVCKALGMRLPYAPGAKLEFIRLVEENKGRVYEEAKYNPKTKKMGRPKKVADPWHYTQVGKETLKKLSAKYKWVEKLLAYKADDKILGTYVIGIQERMRYNVIRPSFLQHGTTSGRYSSKNPNFQNLPRSDKRVKSCIVSRPGKVFVGADYSQLEPRVFASTSGDETLLGCFAKGEDFYSVVGAPIYDKTQCSLYKDAKNSFAVLFPVLRDRSKIIALATPYGRTARQQAMTMGISTEESQMLIDKYFEAYPKVELMMLESHEMAKEHGMVWNLFGRPRRIPAAKDIKRIYGNTPHGELPYEARTLLNLAMNHRVQSTGASIMNRAAVAVARRRAELAKVDPRWLEVKMILQVHDELILEGPEELAEQMQEMLKDCMENTVKLPGVDLEAEPKIAKNLADLK
jgi:DNA polymerase I-like protein with 3'-5' exonuclease and polymerase domains